MSTSAAHEPTTGQPPADSSDAEVGIAGAVPVATESSRPWALSPSRAGDFMSCPLLYRFRVIDRIPEPPDAITTRGTLVHAVLEHLFDHPSPERTIERAQALLEPEWQRLVDERPDLAELFSEKIGDDGGPVSAEQQVQIWLDSAARLIETYFSLEDPRRIEPAQRELLVEVELDGGVRLRGFVDRVDVASTGAVRIVDYKTGSAPSELFEDKALFQLKFYALVMWRVSGSIPAMLQLMYLGDGQLLRYSPDEADLLAAERKVRALWAAIERALENRHFPPRRSRLCDWCSFKPWCPEWGGALPDYPDGDRVVTPVDEPDWSDELVP